MIPGLLELNELPVVDWSATPNPPSSSGKSHQCLLSFHLTGSAADRQLVRQKLLGLVKSRQPQLVLSDAIKPSHVTMYFRAKSIADFEWLKDRFEEITQQHPGIAEIVAVRLGKNYQRGYWA